MEKTLVFFLKLIIKILNEYSIIIGKKNITSKINLINIHLAIIHVKMF